MVTFLIAKSKALGQSRFVVQEQKCAMIGSCNIQKPVLVFFAISIRWEKYAPCAHVNTCTCGGIQCNEVARHPISGGMGEGPKPLPKVWW